MMENDDANAKYRRFQHSFHSIGFTGYLYTISFNAPAWTAFSLWLTSKITMPEILRYKAFGVVNQLNIHEHQRGGRIPFYYVYLSQNEIQCRTTHD